MIKAMQDSLFARNFVGTCLPDVDYAKIAAGFGFHSERVTRPEEIIRAYDRAVDAGGPAVRFVTDCPMPMARTPRSAGSRTRPRRPTW
jgi:acetolactate synthase-1/2/3 large subunit